METTSITGKVIRILFPSHNDKDNPFGIAALDSGLIVKGLINRYIKPGHSFEFIGSYKKDHRGTHFDVVQVLNFSPEDKKGLVIWLTEMFDGIGPVRAKQLYDLYDKEIYQKLANNDIKALTKAKGIGPKKAQEMCDLYINNYQKHADSFARFFDVGLTNWEACRIIEFFESHDQDPWEGLNKNPYVIVKHIDGIGFKRADKIAIEKLKFKKDDIVRIKCAIQYTFIIAKEVGHVYLTFPEIVKALENIGLGIQDYTSDTRLLKLIKELETEGEVKIEEEKIFSSLLYKEEIYCAKKLRELTYIRPQAVSLFGDNFQDNIKDLNECQKKSIDRALINNCYIITGPPGVGKTYSVKRLIRVLSQLENMSEEDIVLAAPTGKAAKVLKDYVKDEFPLIESKTIHRLLEYNPIEGGFLRGEFFPLNQKLIVIDETSMLDVSLLYFLLKAVKRDSRLIFVGDSDQLPSVGPGKVLIDMINSNIIPYDKFTEIVRQKEDSGIILNAVNRINKGLSLQPNDKDFFYKRCGSDDEIIRQTVALVTKQLPATYGYNPLIDIQVITPTKKGYTGTHRLNEVLKETLNSKRDTFVQFGNKTFCIGDKIVNTKNDYYKPKNNDYTLDSSYKDDIFNGYTGLVESIDNKENSMCVNYGGARRKYFNGQHSHLDFAYAMTVHRTQGSEYKCIVIVLSKAYRALLRRNVLYTAVTRAKERVIIIADEYSVDRSIENVYEEPRNTCLAQRLKEI